MFLEFTSLGKYSQSCQFLNILIPEFLPSEYSSSLKEDFIIRDSVLACSRLLPEVELKVNYRCPCGVDATRLIFLVELDQP